MTQSYRHVSHFVSYKWVWPTIIVLSACAVTLVTFEFPHVMVRPAVVMWFLFTCPGMTVVYFFGLAERIIAWVLAIALSFVIDAFIASGLLYAGRWSPVNILMLVIGFCLLGVAIQLVVFCVHRLTLALKQRRAQRPKPVQDAEDDVITLKYPAGRRLQFKWEETDDVAG